MQIGETCSPPEVPTACSEEPDSWIRLRLVRRNRQEVHGWWPKDVLLPFPNEGFEATLTSGSVSSSLGPNGGTWFDALPTGACDFTFPNFYRDIEAWLRENTQ